MSDSTPPPAASASHAPPTEPPRRDARLFRWTALWLLVGLLWSLLTTLFILNTPSVLRWVLFSGHIRYVLVAGILVMIAWSEVRRHAGERLARGYLFLVSTLFGLFAAVLVLALKLTPLLTLLALASFSFGVMVWVGLVLPVKLRKAREALEVLRRIAELTLAGVMLGPELGWFHTVLVLLGLAAMLVVVGDDVQTLSEEARVVREDELQRQATIRAIDMYLSYFRLTLVLAELFVPRKRPKK